MKQKKKTKACVKAESSQMFATNSHDMVNYLHEFRSITTPQIGPSFYVSFTNHRRLRSPTLELLCKHQAIILASRRSAQTFRVFIFAWSPEFVRIYVAPFAETC